MGNAGRVLVVDGGHDRRTRELGLGQGLGEGYRLSFVPDILTARSELATARFAAVLLYVERADEAAAAGSVGALVKAAVDVPVLVLARDDTGADGLIRAGAHDCLPDQPFVYKALGRVVRYAVERVRQTAQMTKLVQTQRASEQLLSQVLSVVGDAVLVFDADGNVLLHNAALSRLLGRDTAALSGRRLDEVLPASAVEEVARQPAGGVVTESRVAVATASGQRTLSLRRLAVTLGAGRRCEVASLATPVDERGASGHAVAGPGAPAGGGAQAEGIAGARVVQLVSLGALRERLGPRWAELQRKVEPICERVIERALGPGDSYLRTEDDDYLLCFAAADEEGAWRTCESVKAQIQERLLGAGVGGGGGPETPGLEGLAGAEVSVSAVPLRPEELRDAADPAAYLRARVVRERRQRNVAAELEEIAGSARCVLLEILTPRGAATPMLRGSWGRDVQRRLGGLREALEADHHLAARADYLMLDALVDLLDHEGKAPGGEAVVVDIRFSTLGKRVVRDELLARLKRAGETAAERFVLNVVGMPDDVYVPHLGELLGRVKPFSRAQAVTLGASHLRTLASAALPARLAIVPYRQLPRGGEEAVQAGAALRRMLDSAGATLIVEHVPPDAVDALVDAYPADLVVFRYGLG